MFSEVMMNEQDAKGAVDRFTQAWNAKDAEAFAACFAEDGDFVNVLGQKAYGRSAIADMHKVAFLKTLRTAVLTEERLEYRRLADDVAAADFWWKVVGSRTREGEPMPERFGLIHFVIEGDGLIVSCRNMDFSHGYGREAGTPVDHG